MISSNSATSHTGRVLGMNCLSEWVYITSLKNLTVLRARNLSLSTTHGPKLCVLRELTLQLIPNALKLSQLRSFMNVKTILTKREPHVSQKVSVQKLGTKRKVL